MHEYKQSTGYTTASSSLLMIINHYNPDFELSKENEFEIWRASVNLPTRASDIFGLANFAKKQGLKLKIIVEETDFNYPDYRFKRYTKSDIEEAKFMSSQYEKKAMELGIEIENKEISANQIMNLLNEGKILMLRCNAGIFRETSSTSKYLVFHKPKGANSIKVYDPEGEPLSIDEEKLSEALETLHSKKKRDSRMIIFSD